jgi:hypothetical protein
MFIRLWDETQQSRPRPGSDKAALSTGWFDFYFGSEISDPGFIHKPSLIRWRCTTTPALYLSPTFFDIQTPPAHIVFQHGPSHAGHWQLSFSEKLTLSSSIRSVA